MLRVGLQRTVVDIPVWGMRIPKGLVDHGRQKLGGSDRGSDKDAASQSLVFGGTW